MKLFDTINHDMMLKILERYDAPPKMCSTISKMCQDLKIVLKIVKVEENMGQTVGVRQGYCMAPVLLLFMVMAFAENLENEWIKAGLQMATLKQHSHPPRDVGRLTSQKKNFAQVTLLALLCVLYVDYGALTFEERDQITRCLSLIFSHFKNS